MLQVIKIIVMVVASAWCSVYLTIFGYSVYETLKKLFKNK